MITTRAQLIKDVASTLMDARWDGRYEDYCLQGAEAVVDFFVEELGEEVISDYSDGLWHT